MNARAADSRSSSYPRWLRRIVVPTVDPVPQPGSAFPVAQLSDRVSPDLVALVAVVLTVFSAVTMDPFGLHGRGLVGVLLLVANCVLALSRVISDDIIVARWRIAIAITTAICAGVLAGLYPTGFAVAFAYMTAVYAGREFRPGTAVALAALCGATHAITLTLDNDNHTLLWLPATVTWTVWIGISRRNRRITMLALRDLVLATQRSVESEARSSALAERGRIARDLHDVLAHSLSGVNMQLQLADALLDAGRDGDARAALTRAQTLVVDGLGDARRAVHALREDTLEVVPTLHKMVTGPHEELEVRCAPGDLRLSSDAEEAVVRIAQEALTNARRHAPHQPVRVIVDTDGHDVTVQIRNAAAAAAASQVGSQMGLIGMRERAAHIGATLHAGPVEDGWVVDLRVPMTASNQRDEDHHD